MKLKKKKKNLDRHNVPLAISLLWGQHFSFQLWHIISVLTPELCTFISEFKGVFFCGWVCLQDRSKLSVWILMVPWGEKTWHVPSQGTVRGAGMGCRFHFLTWSLSESQFCCNSCSQSSPCTRCAASLGCTDSALRALQPIQASSWDLSNKMFPSQAPLQLSLPLADFVPLSLPDGDDEGQHFQQDGDDEHHDGRRGWRGRGHAVLQETRDGEDEEDCGGQEHVQERAEGCTGKRLHWSIPYNLCGAQGLRDGMARNKCYFAEFNCMMNRSS